jgi:hypothetical protein
MERIEVILDNLRTHFMISAIGNAVAFVFGVVGVIAAGTATCGVGCLFFFLPVVNLTVMIFDFLSMSKVRQPASPKGYSFLKMASIFDIFACLAVVPLIMGILNLQILGKPEVYAYFHPQSQELS